MPVARQSAQFDSRLKALLQQIYPGENLATLRREVVAAFWPEGTGYRSRARQPGHSLWDETDTLVITYGNTLVDGQHKPLDLLRDFLNRYLRGVVKGVHILPFFPFTSDDGFAVTDYRVVNSQLGDWSDVQRIGEEFRLMSDLVLNHVSSMSYWFTEYRQGHAPYDRFFVEASPDADLSDVVRPRTSPLLREVDTAQGRKHVWCTFSHDQIDLDFRNPEVLLEFLRIMRLHIENGVRIIRLDAVAFIWKEIGTSCIHLPQTHAIVRLMRLLCDYAEERVVLLTETNVPNAENLSYFGNRNEAHMIYNFSLPPLLLHALLSGTSVHLNHWLMRMPPAQLGCAYLNFSASHDGIGVRGAEGLLSGEEMGQMIKTVQNFGGLVSMRALSDGSEKPYELNITYFDALKGTIGKGEDGLQIDRFLCSQTIIMSLEGVPAFYIHSLLATHNDHAGVEKTGVKRAINRHRWDYPSLRTLLDDPESVNAQVLAEMKRRIAIRMAQKAFHPNATQFTMQLGPEIFGLWRQSPARDQSIFALHNVTDAVVEVPHISINLIDGEDWYDLLSGEKIDLSRPNLRFAPYQCRWISNRP
ncbi:sugar phosphorylase [Celeribacter indicus]|uniref:Alpha amylase n=1 Tax=Celeribacter indicus TaxID=1208324 RepID=A0A0B5DS71_9RHOB|nr:sugar phosphorylase [Celeribacter indicus]AJE45884.1 alpha amylase [Celeribacter indicus]SDW62955.1 sucrose phosphorylase [Celeribacter indicus]